MTPGIGHKQGVVVPSQIEMRAWDVQAIDRIFIIVAKCLFDCAGLALTRRTTEPAVSADKDLYRHRRHQR